MYIDTMKNYIFDTQIYDWISDENINVDIIKAKGLFYITNIQLSEIKNIPNPDRRSKILNVVNTIEPIKLKIEPGVWIDKLHWDDEEVWSDEPNENIIRIIGNTTNKNKWQDAIIGDIAIKNNLILVTKDDTFKSRALQNNIICISIEEFMNN